MFLLVPACLKDYLESCQQLISALPFGLNQAEVMHLQSLTPPCRSVNYCFWKRNLLLRVGDRKVAW